MQNSELSKAVDALERYLEDEEVYRAYIQRQSAIWDYNNDIQSSYEEGFEEGREEARKEARAKARKEGTREKTISIVCNLLDMEMPVEEIAEVVEISVDEVRDIAAKHDKP